MMQARAASLFKIKASYYGVCIANQGHWSISHTFRNAYIESVSQ